MQNELNAAPSVAIGLDQAPISPEQKNTRASLYAFIGSIVVAAVYGRVVVFNLWGGVVGGNIDGYENLWNDYWTRTALLSGHNPFFTNYIYYPTGVSLRFHTLHPITGLFAVPLWPIFGPVASTNLFFLISLALTCFFSYLLINELVRNPLAAFAGAALFTCAYVNGHSYNILGAGQTNILAVQWLPLYFLYLHRLIYLPKQKVRNTVLSVVSLLLMSLTDWQFVLFAVLFTVLFFAFILFTRRRWLEKGLIFLQLSAVGGVWLALVFLPLLLPMIEESGKNSWLSISDQSVYRSMDLVDYLWTEMVNPGYLAIAIMLLGFGFAWRKKISREAITFWAISGVLGAILSLGPKLIIGGNITDFPMPYSFLYKLPLLSVGRDPGRFQTIYLITFSILFAFGIRFLIERHFFWSALSRLSVRWKRFVMSGVVVIILSISVFGFVAESGKVKAVPYDVPAFYEQLGKDTEQYALMELPLFSYAGRDGLVNPEGNRQAYQAIYNKWRISGRYARDHHLSNPTIFALRETYIRDFYWLGATQEKLYRTDKD
ncbi:hypothetical protein, partial [Candidatus Chlorohelix sp.]|uniref:hypothetical protein n=1 Tax=Candidatus Chlorohelix sp. TaxID=3139201 RepID=UPI00302D9B34